MVAAVPAVAEAVVAEVVAVVVKRTMKQKAVNLRNHFIVCGYGLVCQRITHFLAHLGYNAVAISQLSLSSNVTNKKIRTIFADARDITSLQKANIAKARGIAHESLQCENFCIVKIPLQ